MPKPPPKYKPEQEYTPDEVLRSMRGERIESEEFRRYHADALRAAGLTQEADAVEPDSTKALDEMTPADHLDAIRRAR